MRSPALAAPTLSVKLVPPALGPAQLARPRLEALVGEVMSRRLTVVTAEAGFGKSTLLASWAAQANCAWYSLGSEDAAPPALARGVVDALRLRVPGMPLELSAALSAGGGRAPDDGGEVERGQALARFLAEALEAGLARELILVLDDVDEAGLSPGAGELMASLCRQAPPNFHLVVGSRREPPFAIERLRGRGQVLELGARELAFSLEETAELVARHEVRAPAALLERLHRLTDGWPAAVRLAVEALRNGGADQYEGIVEQLGRPGGALYRYLTAEVLRAEPEKAQRLVSLVAAAGFAAPELCERLGVAGAGEVLRSLARRGLFVEGRGQRLGWFSLTSLVQEAAAGMSPLTGEEARQVERVTAEWLEEQGNFSEALRYAREHCDWATASSLLARRGPALLSMGEVREMLATFEAVPSGERSAETFVIAGDALCMLGDWDGALGCYRRAAGPNGPLPLHLAWRVARTHHFRGDLNLALEAYGEADVIEGDYRDAAMLLGWRASARWLRGDAEGCRRDAARATELALRAGDPGALCCAYTALAMLAALDGDRVANDALYLRALDYAVQAGDVPQQVRVRTNRGSLHLEQGYYQEAISELDLALRLAELAGFNSYRALALSNRGCAHYFLGRLEEAVSDLEESRRQSERLGSADVSYALAHLGRIYVDRGDLALARAAYEEAIKRCEATADVQGLVPALSGLAVALAFDEPGTAEALAARAVSFGPGMAYVDALLAAGWVALAGRRGDEARRLAEQAAAEARSRRDRAGLAQALELAGLCPPGRVADLEQAVALWAEMGSTTGKARADLLAGLLTGGSSRVEQASSTLKRLGVRSEPALRRLAARAAPAPAPRPSAEPAVLVQALGRFRVTVGGATVPASAWQSRKARDLLKILVARRGRPVPREELMDLLWPEEPVEKLANRFSVALSTLRAALGQGKSTSSSHFVISTRDSCRLDLDHVDVDVERFLRDVSAGLAAARSGGPAPGAPNLLARAEAAYTGDFLEENAYDDWAVGLREEARAAYISACRALADEARRSGDLVSAARYLRRLLERDPYDEQAHLALVAALAGARQHGEAHRCYGAYSSRMREIGIEPAPLPGHQR